jgi:rRNA-processing protein EBP2
MSFAINLTKKKPLNLSVQAALDRIRQTIQLDPSFPWTETLTVSYPETIDVDVEDDLNRELALFVSSVRLSI